MGKIEVLISSLQSLFAQNRRFKVNWGELHICNRGTLLTFPFISFNSKIRIRPMNR